MIKYRVEAFIIPSNGQIEVEANQIDDVKLVNKVKERSVDSSAELEEPNTIDREKKNVISTSCLQSKIDDDQCSSEFSGIFFDINEHIYDEIIIQDDKKKKDVKNKDINTEYTKAYLKIDEPIYDEPFVGNIINSNSTNNASDQVAPQTRWTLANSKYRRFGIVAPKIPKRTTSLKSIVEDNESFDETLQEICCHGRKNGCFLNNERPEDISDEIFKENWMQRLDALRKLETLLKDKEIALQSRERLLFKKEKELRILERLVKDKMKQVELYAKRYKKSLSLENVTNDERNLESRSSNGSRGQANSECSFNSLNKALKTTSKISLESKNNLLLSNSLKSKSLPVMSGLNHRIGSVRSRARPQQKMTYDDLDSTLSADIGDSSFVVTSRKFDPETVKKPAAFARSASERRPKAEQQFTTQRLCKLIDKDQHTDIVFNTIEERTLKKISANILASQNQETKFLNYGLIDEEPSINLSNHNHKEFANQNRFSYLNLESTSKTTDAKKVPKERPISWSEESDDWLKKKRQAYNLTAQMMASENIIGKENNHGQHKVNKSTKDTKKKENRKKFSIFR